MNTEKLIATIRKIGAKIEAEKDFLTEQGIRALY